MGRRVAVAAALFALVGVERLGWYSMRLAISVSVSEGAQELLTSTNGWVLKVSMLTALVALLVPRVVLLVVGCVVALTGAALAFASVDVDLGIWLQCIGVGIERVVWMTMLAVIPQRPVVKIALVVMSYAVVNVGATAAFAFRASPWLPPAVAFGAATLFAILTAVLRLHPGAEAPPSGDAPRAIVALCLGSPAVVAVWELTTRSMTLPQFDMIPWFWSLTMAVATGCGVAALAFLVARQWAAEVVSTLLLVGALSLAACCGVAVFAPPQSEAGLVGLNLAASLVEGLGYATLLGFVIGWSPPRVGPLLSACVLFASTVVTRLESLPSIVHDALMVAGSLAALALAGLTLALRKKFFSSLVDGDGATQSAQASAPSSGS